MNILTGSEEGCKPSDATHACTAAGQDCRRNKA